MNIIKKINLLTTAILFFLIGVFISIVTLLDIIPYKYLVLLTIICGIILGFIFVITISRKLRKKLRILTIIFSVIMIIILGIGCFYLNYTMKFMNEIQSSNYQVDEYYVLVLNDSSYQNLSNLKETTIGIYQNNLKDYMENLNELKEDYSLSIKEYSNYFLACEALLNGDVKSIYISSSYKDLLAEEIEGFNDKIRILEKEQVKIKVESVIAKSRDVTNKSFNIYISGIDVAGSISRVSRSDVNMLVTVNPKTKQILLTSIPRDYYVRLHGTNGYRDKLTHSGIYGIDMTINTVEDLLGIDIDYYARVNFTTVINIVDAIGGIDVYSDKAFRAWTNGSCTYQVGMMHLDGKCALAFARERYAYQEGDRHRIKNQQDVLTAILNKCLSSKVLMTQYHTMLKSFSYSFQTNMPTESIYKLINMQLDSMSNWNIEQIRLDGYGKSEYTYSYPGQRLYVMEPNQSTIELAKQKINEIEGTN